jgi:hypothetical protein
MTASYTHPLTYTAPSASFAQTPAQRPGPTFAAPGDPAAPPAAQDAEITVDRSLSALAVPGMTHGLTHTQDDFNNGADPFYGAAQTLLTALGASPYYHNIHTYAFGRRVPWRYPPSAVVTYMQGLGHWTVPASTPALVSPPTGHVPIVGGLYTQEAPNFGAQNATTGLDGGSGMDQTMQLALDCGGIPMITLLGCGDWLTSMWMPIQNEVSGAPGWPNGASVPCVNPSSTSSEVLYESFGNFSGLFTVHYYAIAPPVTWQADASGRTFGDYWAAFVRSIATRYSSYGAPGRGNATSNANIHTDSSVVSGYPLALNTPQFIPAGKTAAQMTEADNVLAYQIWNEFKEIDFPNTTAYSSKADGTAIAEGNQTAQSWDNNWDYAQMAWLYSITAAALRSINPNITCAGPYIDLRENSYYNYNSGAPSYSAFTQSVGVMARDRQAITGFLALQDGGTYTPWTEGAAGPTAPSATILPFRDMLDLFINDGGHPDSFGVTTVKTVVVTNGGSGYTSAPTVTIDPPWDSGTLTTSADIFAHTATATATVSGGHVTAVTVTDGGAHYTAPPQVTFSGGGGSGAAASAVLASYQSPDADPDTFRLHIMQNTPRFAALAADMADIAASYGHRGIPLGQVEYYTDANLSGVNPQGSHLWYLNHDANNAALTSTLLHALAGGYSYALKWGATARYFTPSGAPYDLYSYYGDRQSLWSDVRAYPQSGSPAAPLNTSLPNDPGGYYGDPVANAIVDTRSGLATSYSSATGAQPYPLYQSMLFLAQHFGPGASVWRGTSTDTMVEAFAANGVLVLINKHPDQRNIGLRVTTPPAGPARSVMTLQGYGVALLHL